LTLALEGGEGSASRPCRTLPPGKTQYPIYRSLGGPQGWSGQVLEISPPPEFDPRTVQPIGSIPTTLPGPLSTFNTFLKIIVLFRQAALHRHARSWQ